MTARLEWVTDPERFGALAGPWDALAEREPDPFGLHAWFAAWWRAFAGVGSLNVCLLWEGECLAAAFPLRRQRGLLEALANEHTPVLRPLALDGPALERVTEEVMAVPARELRVEALPARGKEVGTLAECARRAGRPSLTESQRVSPIVDTSCSVDEFRRATKPRWGAPLDRFRRKLEREHEARFVVVRSPEDLERELRDGFVLEAGGWKGRAGTAIQSSPRTVDFYSSVARAFHKRGELRLSRLVLDGRIVAFDLSLLYRGRLFLLKTAYDESYRRFAPGLVLRLAIIERCIELGLEAHELLGSDEEWKRKFSVAERRHEVFRAYGRRPSGLAAYGYRAVLRPPLRRAYRGARALSASRARSPRAGSRSCLRRSG